MHDDDATLSSGDEASGSKMPRLSRQERMLGAPAPKHLQQAQLQRRKKTVAGESCTRMYMYESIMLFV